MGTSPSEPYADLEAAQAAAKEYGGKIIKRDPAPEVEKGMIY
jgi:nitrous oxide reductase accessory protein NosL